MSAQTGVLDTFRLELADLRQYRFFEFRPLGRVAKLVLSILLVILIGGKLLELWEPLDYAPILYVFDLGLLLSLTLFLWHPPVATIVMTALSYTWLIDEEPGVALSVAVFAAGLVVYTCSLWLSASHVIALVICGYLVTINGGPPGAALAILLLATICTFMGATTRFLVNARERTAHDLATAELMAATTLADERERIADELHDIVAHDLTVVIMHSHLLTRLQTSSEAHTSLRAIRESAAKALADVRRLIDGREDLSPHDTITDALRDVTLELSELGFAVTTSDVPDVPSTLLESTLARAIRESATNIIKHARPDSPVSYALTIEHGDVILTTTNELVPAPNARTTSGRGLPRLGARVDQLSGVLTAERDDTTWTLRIALPISPFGNALRTDALAIQGYS
ncbi:sensor histidine kinase [Microbacterium amylolyticum]|uniref:histidine kinase n=1 Tax=Microbacterium amylolyticum TaxID=936337 RepID=A0ABS4ZHU3_9MICO|nr:histidine kinase [Microbacterium amylolyticum]MBP2436843.1 signal transduction histidine kinase [Microbacterium amylolyticum]